MIPQRYRLPPISLYRIFTATMAQALYQGQLQIAAILVNNLLSPCIAGWKISRWVLKDSRNFLKTVGLLSQSDNFPQLCLAPI
jgi:hypothetical protein